MPKRSLIKLVMVLSLLVPASVYSQDREIREYTVKKGDTLWGISGEELHDPFLWPKIWKENPGISDPDRLSPGQTIRIPLYVLQEERKEQAEKQPAAEIVEAEKPSMAEEPKAPELRPLVNQDLYVSSGYIASSIDSVGMVSGSPSGRTLFGNADDVYLQTNAPGQVGDRFYIVRVERMITHPVTHNQMGYLVTVLGTAEITSLRFGDTRAKITKAYRDIVTGDILLTYTETSPPMIAGPYRKPDIEGVVLASRSAHIYNSLFDIVYLDKGKQDGIEEGDMFETVFVGDHYIPNGVVQVIHTGNNTSTAIVRGNAEANEPIAVGNIFTRLE